MTHIWVPNKEVYCPLCLLPFKKRKVSIHGQLIEVYFCRTDSVFTFSFDPAFNKWFDTNKTISCPKCENPLRWFCRYTDGFFKSLCGTCNLEIKRDIAPNFDTKTGEIDLDEFDQNKPTESMIYLPVDKLKISEEQKRRLKYKLRKRGA